MTGAEDGVVTYDIPESDPHETWPSPDKENAGEACDQLPVEVSPTMASSWIIARPTRDGDRRYRVLYRLGGRVSRARYPGSFKTKAEALARKRWVDGELAARRVPDVMTLEREPARAPTLAEAAKRWRESIRAIALQTTSARWRTHWRTGAKPPAHRQFLGGLESR